MYFIYKVCEENESYKSISMKLFNQDKCWVVLEKINEHIIKKTDSKFMIGTEIYIPSYFNKYIYRNIAMRVFLNKTDTDFFNNLNFYLKKNDNYFEYDQYYNINQENFFTKIDINNSKVHNKIISFSYPTANKHIFLLKKYGLGKILILPSMYYVNSLLNNKVNYKSNDNFSKVMLDILDKDNENVSLELCQNQVTQLTNINRKIVQYINCDNHYDLDYIENLTNSQVFDSGSSLVVVLQESSKEASKNYFQNAFGISVSSEKINFPSFQYRPFGLLQAIDNYAEISNTYRLTMAQVSRQKLNNTYNYHRSKEDNFEFYMKIVSENTLPVRPFSNRFTSFDAFLYLKELERIIHLDRLINILYCVYYYDIDLFNFVTCFQINNLLEEDENEFFAFRLNFRGDWHEILVKKPPLINKKLLSIEINALYLAEAIFKLYTNKESKNYHELIEFLYSIESVDLISIIYGSVPVLRQLNNISTKNGICLMLDKKELLFDYHFKACAKNLDGSFYTTPDLSQKKESFVWFPHLQNEQSKYKTLYEIKHVLEKGYIYGHLKEESDVMLNSKNFIPIFLPEYFVNERERSVGFKYKLTVWILSETSIDLEYSSFFFKGSINDYSSLVSSKNFTSKTIQLKEIKKLESEEKSINLEIEKDQVLLLLIDNLNERQDISIRVVFNELNNKQIPLHKHQIMENETLKTIALKYYGNEDLWLKIYEENKNIIGLNTEQLDLFSVIDIPKLN